MSHSLLQRLAHRLICLGFLVATPTLLLAAETAKPAAKPAPAKRVGDIYPLATCPVSGKALGKDAVIKVDDGREVRFCCGDCPAKYEADKAKYNKQIDDAVIAAQKPHYTLTTCPVSGEKIGGSMGEGVDVVVDNRYMKLCCNDCKHELTADPAKFIKKQDEMIIARELPGYPLETCVVSGDKFGGDMGPALDVVYEGRLVRLCCKGCIKNLEADPAKYLAKIDAAAKAKPSGDDKK
jgi:hypothetical protein